MELLQAEMENQVICECEPKMLTGIYELVMLFQNLQYVSEVVNYKKNVEKMGFVLIWAEGPLYHSNYGT